MQHLTITCNGTQLCIINDYNLLYNTLYDLKGTDFSPMSKRFLENAEPSVYDYRDDTDASIVALELLMLKMVLLLLMLKLNAQ
jgi:hypothetical protein